MNLTKTSKIILIVLLLAIAFLAGHYNIDITGIEDRSYALGYDDAWVKASGIVENSSVFPKMSDEMYSISGEIKTVSGNILTIEAYSVSLNPLSDDSKTTTRQVTITKDTEIAKQIPKTPEEINEMIKDGEIVSLFSEESVSPDNIKEGEIIQIVSDVDIKHEYEITAIKIIVSTALM